MIAACRHNVVGGSPLSRWWGCGGRRSRVGVATAQRSAGAPGGREGRAADSAVVRMNAVLRGGMQRLTLVGIRRDLEA